jgi:hypothetical protein
MKNLGIFSWYLAVMEMTARKYFTCPIIQYSYMTVAPPNSGQHLTQV